MRKLLMVFVALVATLAFASVASAASSPSPITYTGQGMTGDKASLQLCGTLADDGGTGGDVSGNYLLWNLPGVASTATTVTLHLPDGDHAMVFNGTWKYVSQTFTLAELDNIASASWDGGGEANNLTVSHGCNGKLTGQIKTDIKDKDGNVITSASLGSVVHDSVTFTPALGSSEADMKDNATVTYHFYNGACGDNSSEVGTGETVAAGNNSSDTAALAAGSYHYTASYSGNDKYNSITASDCEPLTINKAQLTIVTQIHGVNGAHGDVGGATHVGLGSTVHDTATVSGAVAGFPAPGADDVSFTRDSGGGFVAINKDAAGETGFTARTVESEGLHAGSWTYKAHVNGNDNYLATDSDDEPLTVDRAQLSITTDIHNSSHSIITTALVNSIVHDTATVSGAVAGFDIGAVSFTLDGADAGPTSNESGTVFRSANSGAMTLGNHTYKASVAGNDNYIGALSADEPLSITKPSAWCSPGYWKNASNASWAQVGLTSAAVGKAKTFNSTVAAAGFYPLLTGANVNVTIGQVLGASGANTYGPAAGQYNLNPFNAVGAYLTSLIPGYAWTGTASGTCPISNGGVLTPPPVS